MIKGIVEQFRPILEGSEQAIYIYMDDMHKICNKKFADMLGFSTPKEWANTIEPFTDLFVGNKSTEDLVSAYQAAMERMAGSKVSVTWKKKGGGAVKTDVILVPISFSGHLFALHFVEQL